MFLYSFCRHPLLRPQHIEKYCLIFTKKLQYNITYLFNVRHFQHELAKKNLGLNGDGTLSEFPVIKMLAEGSN